jgi:hypothetical protein
MNFQGDPFNGKWRFDPELSRLSAAAPQSWIQEIRTGPDGVSVREQIARADGTEIVLRVKAKFDGADYAVDGSPIIDAIAYTRTDGNTISGVGKKKMARWP